MGGNSESLEGGPEPVNAAVVWKGLVDTAESIAAGGKVSRVLAALAETLTAAGAGQVFVFKRKPRPTSEDPEWTTVIAAGVEDVGDRPRTFDYVRSLADWVERSGKPLLVSDVAGDSRFSDPPGETTTVSAYPLSAAGNRDACLILVNPPPGIGFEEWGRFAAVLTGWILEREERKRRENALLRSLENQEREVLRLERKAAVGDAAEEMNREISAPLVSMGRLADDVAESLAPDDSRRTPLETIVEQASRLLRLLNDHRELTRTPEPDLQPEDVNRLAAEALGLLKQEFKKHHVAVTRRLGSDLPLLLLDPDLMRRVFLNLLRSGLESAAPGGRLKVETKRRGDRVEILVAADGKREAGESLARLWDPFQGETDHGGNLSRVSVRRILRDHHGVLRAAATPDWPLVYSLVLPIQENRDRRRGARDRRKTA